MKTHPPKLSCLAENEVFITSNGVHLDIIVPVEDLYPQLVTQLNFKKGTKYISFGWGDKDFYINTPEWSDLKFSVAFKALFLKSQTALHVTGYPQSYGSWRSVTICDEQLEILNNYISKSFIKDEKGSINGFKVKGYGINDNFYDARGSFSVFKTCNIWTNTALKETGIKTSVWSPFDFGVLYHLPDNK